MSNEGMEKNEWRVTQTEWGSGSQAQNNENRVGMVIQNTIGLWIHITSEGQTIVR